MRRLIPMPLSCCSLQSPGLEVPTAAVALLLSLVVLAMISLQSVADGKLSFHVLQVRAWWWNKLSFQTMIELP